MTLSPHPSEPPLPAPLWGAWGGLGGGGGPMGDVQAGVTDASAGSCDGLETIKPIGRS